tara:strand:+ start:130 stop:354 length:225 start_codon:yes stop_codon:yes gene_type:complete
VTKKEKEEMRVLFKANPVLREPFVKELFNRSLRSVIEETYPECSEKEHIEIYSETLLQVDELVCELDSKQRVLN